MFLFYDKYKINFLKQLKGQPTFACMKFLLAFIRFLGMACLLGAHTLWAMIGVGIFGASLPWAMRVRRSAVRTALWWMRVRIERFGNPPEGTFLYIGNHQSYLDPVVTLKFTDAMPVAKAEVENWPIIGRGVKATGVLFVKREHKGSRADTLRSVKKALLESCSILIYPEGTTTDQAHTLPFRPGAFHVAAEIGVPIVPVAILYGRKSDAWIGDDTFVRHFFATFGHWETRVRLYFGAPIVGSEGERLRVESQEAIDRMLQQMEV